MLVNKLFTKSISYIRLLRYSKNFFCSESKTESVTITEVKKIPLDVIVDRTHHSGNLVCIGLNRPLVKNALGINLIKQLEGIIEELSSDKCTARTVLFHSLVSGVFCAGADLKERINVPDSDVGPLVSQARELFHDIAKLKMPTICAMDGIAFGGGLELALACDIRIAASNCTMGLVETKLGIFPGAGGTQRLPRLIGIAKAKELIFTGRKIDANEALSLNLVNKVVPQNETGNAAFNESLLMCQILVNDVGPLALRWAKVAISEGMENAKMIEALDIEDVCYSQIIETADRKEGLKAFIEKRPPKFEGN